MVKLRKCQLYRQIYAKFAINLRIALKVFSENIVNMRLRACLTMCLKYGQFQPKRAYKAPAYSYKRKVFSKSKAEFAAIHNFPKQALDESRFVGDRVFAGMGRFRRRRLGSGRSRRRRG